ncbi:MAG: DJ-1/PfpI family protein [Treponema sp.]|nr:DJ-1/PfpI family protein [Treponema sp.]
MKAAVFFADGFEEIEALSPVDYMRRAGIEVITVGVKGTPFNKTLIVTSSHNVPMIMDMSMQDFFAEYANNLPDCIVCPGGGKGAVNLSECKELLDYIEKCNLEGKLVTAICASPAVVFGKTNVLKDKKWTCYPGMDGEANPDFAGGYSDKVFVHDGNIITSRGAGSSEEFAMEIVRTLAGEEMYTKVKTGTLQR